jgi:hypothetical protein
MLRCRRSIKHFWLTLPEMTSNSRELRITPPHRHASRKCDPDAALWGDTVSGSTFTDGSPGPVEGYTHSLSGRASLAATGTPWGFWKASTAFADLDRQNLGRVDGSVRVRKRSEFHPNPSSVGAGLTWGGGTAYSWWY